MPKGIYPSLEKLETRFDMSFKDIIEKIHLEQKVSVKDLAMQAGVSRSLFDIHSKRLGLKLRGQAESTRVCLKNRGEKHWCFGKKRPDTSKRMTENNPAFRSENLERAAKTRSAYFKDNLLPQEVEYKSFLEREGVDFESQYPTGPYIIDFFIESVGLCIEIDSTKKWGKERRRKAEIKDRFLKSRGFKVLRIEKSLVSDSDKMALLLSEQGI